MMQWMNLHRNNSFINRTRLPLLCEKSGTILLVLVGLMAGRLAVRQASSQMKYWEISKFLKFSTDCTIGIFTAFHIYTYIMTLYSLRRHVS